MKPEREALAFIIQNSEVGWLTLCSWISRRWDSLAPGLDAREYLQALERKSLQSPNLPAPS